MRFTGWVLLIIGLSLAYDQLGTALCEREIRVPTLRKSWKWSCEEVYRGSWPICWDHPLEDHVEYDMKIKR